MPAYLLCIFNRNKTICDLLFYMRTHLFLDVLDNGNATGLRLLFCASGGRNSRPHAVIWHVQSEKNLKIHWLYKNCKTLIF